MYSFNRFSKRGILGLTSLVNPSREVVPFPGDRDLHVWIEIVILGVRTRRYAQRLHWIHDIEVRERGLWKFTPVAVGLAVMPERHSIPSLEGERPLVVIA